MAEINDNEEQRFHIQSIMTKEQMEELAHIINIGLIHADTPVGFATEFADELDHLAGRQGAGNHILVLKHSGPLRG